MLPGAGARGAYQVGVLKALASLLPERAPNPFSVICGTSAGAINAAVLAGRAANFERAVADMEHVWGNFSASQVYRADDWTMLKTSAHWLAAGTLGGLGVRNPASLLDNSPLRELLAQNVRFDGIGRAIDQGHLDAVAITASAYATARSVTFFEGRPELASWTRIRRIGRATKLTVDHLMASSAVPFVFPPVQIGGEFYGDGSMRHRAPLSPAIHLGADRMLIVGVRDERPDAEPPAGAKPEPPTFAHLGGYMLDTLFMDGLYTDLERLSRTNRILEQLGDKKLTGNLAALRPLHTLVIVPHQDLRSVAAQYVDELPRGVRLLLRGLGAGARSGMQLVSYLLFESGFTRALIDMGYRDAMEMEDELRAFIFDEPMATLYAPAHLKLALDR
ncbi:MAG TPA: patatin-like phospholipase family protein [Gammaproteobacteria bacterium]|nr:patatin-like phospholipase family protein [Gammaproteobacteria bacterium]